ncbi:hypothetical protein [Streptomyces sp. NPDC053560]|uniref:hypothetical protein n=1 Tax=Streptomyces sp. NPDC053560 TaxID=3365711 RepID=UPI0037D166D3
MSRNVSRNVRTPAGVLVVALASVLGIALGLLLTSCQEQGDARPPYATGSVRPSGVLPPGYGAVFLDRGECSTRGQGAAFREVGCGSGAAAARVLARYAGGQGGGARCPARTDFVLHISEHRPDADEDGDGSVPQGYACMRNLRAPHPGDPGQGGGPRTVPGDCVYLAAGLQARETPCGGPRSRASQSGESRSGESHSGESHPSESRSGESQPGDSRSGTRHRPEYEVTATVRSRASCPSGTALYLRLPDRTTGCARRLGPG